MDKLDGWAEDLKLGLEREIKDLDRQLREVRRTAAMAVTLEEKLAGQKQIKALEKLRTSKRKSLFDAQDGIDLRREKLVESIEGRLKQTTDVIALFTIRWILS